MDSHSLVARSLFRHRRYLATLLILLFAACRLPAQSGPKTLRPLDLLENATTHLNHNVDIEILEPLYGPSTREQLARTEYGQVEIRIPEGMTGRLSLVPGPFKVDDPNRYRKKFDQVVESPLRVHGEFLIDDEMTKAEHRPIYVIRVSSMEPVVLGSPEKVSLQDLNSNPARWDRKQIVYEGVYRRGFEISGLDEIWLEASPKATILNKPGESTGLSSNRVRVTGILFARPGAHYGHLGGYRFQITASKIEYLVTAQ